MTDVSKNQLRPQLTVDEIELIIASLQVLTVKPAADLAARLKTAVHLEKDPAFRARRDAYRNAVLTDDETQVDNDAEVSFGDDPGAYVMAWLWVTEEAAGICAECGEPNANNGEGWNGLCGNCADRAEAEEDEGTDIVCVNCADITTTADSPDGELCPDCFAQQELEGA